MKPQDDPLQNWKRPKIVIRKRTLNEVRDLATRVVCSEFKPAALYFMVLALPTLILNYVFWFFLFEAFGLSFWSGSQYDAVFHFSHYFWSFVSLAFWVWLTITLEVQFVGSLVTEYLGIWLFSGDEKIPVKRVFREWRQRLFQLFYYLVFTRVIRFRSFYPETILLERHPFFGRAGRLSTRRRVKNINSADVGTEAFSAFIGTEFYILAGVVFGCVISYFFISTIMGDRVLSWFISTIFVFPTFLMACRLFNVVYNFCNYINYRISCEGWDVDLTFKTELVRLGVSLADATDGGAHGRARRRLRTLGPLTLDSDLNASNATPAPDVVNAEEDKETTHEN
ncbi:MAG: hypothetical protein ACOX0A_05670 [Thermoguttaceae bacterium]